ncbi:MAG: response regulator transcription factor [Methylacidiphilales bacterium]|nr:response regulator transcription factor [Candidatus Methylacidiphilales bacterium]
MIDSDKKLVLVADSDPHIIQFIKMNLEQGGFHVATAENGHDAINKTRELLPDCVILDVIMPDMDEFEVLFLIRKESYVPVIILTAKSAENDKIKGLSMGADDYITKPFNPRELVMRTKAIIRRAELPPMLNGSNIHVDNHLTIDFKNREAIVEGKPIKLSPTEWRLLYYLVQNAGRVISNEQLLSWVWGWEYRDDTKKLNLYIKYLRNKLEIDPYNPRYILTERGTGYRFVDFHKILEEKQDDKIDQNQFQIC